MAKPTYRRKGYLAYSARGLGFIMTGECGSRWQPWWPDRIKGSQFELLLRSTGELGNACGFEMSKSPSLVTKSASRRATPLDLFHKVPETGKQVFKHLCLWDALSFKVPHPDTRENWSQWKLCSSNVFHCRSHPERDWGHSETEYFPFLKVFSAQLNLRPDLCCNKNLKA